MKLLFVICCGLFLLSCSGFETKRSTEGRKATGFSNIDNSCDSCSFKTFWEGFKRAAIHSDKKSMTNYVSFPFNDNFNIVYNPESNLSCKNSIEFHELYEQIFNQYVLEAIRVSNYRGYDGAYSEYGDIIEETDYLLMTDDPSESSDLIFQKVNDEYRLVGIQYYE